MTDLLKLYDTYGRWLLAILPAFAVGSIVVGWFLGIGQKAGEAFAQEFAKYFGKAAAEWIHDRSAPFKLQYTTYLSNLVRHVDLKGFAQDSPFALELLDVFVDLSLDSQPHRNTRTAAISIPEALASGRHSIWEYLEQPQRRLAIIGAPGSGKTTLLKHLILIGCAPKRPAPRKALAALPVFIEIRKHAKSIGEKPDYGLADAAIDQLGAFGKRASKSWFDSKLTGGGCLVLIDGLDEVADAQLRQKVVNWVEVQVAAYDGNRYVVTSRPNGYKSNPIQGFNTLEVQSLTPDDVRRFVHSWYLATEVAHHQGAKSAAVRAKAEDGANGLLGKLRQSSDLSDLASNPLLLTMIATVHRFRGSLPGSRVELYAEIASVFLGRRRQARELDFELRPDQKQSVLEPLAFEMMMRRLKEISQNDACALISKPLEAVRPNTRPADFLTEIESTSGLFVERENGVWGFAHLTVQEYLAAVHIRSLRLVASLIGRVHETWWHETVRLYVAQADATTIIEACIGVKPPTVESLVLAIQCLEEAKTVDAESRRRCQNQIANAVESQDPEVRRPVAEALLHLRLAKMEACGGDRLISDYITNTEYQLFVDALREKGEYRQPDHWNFYTFPAGTASQVVAGVRASDAAAFAKWLSARSPGAFLYQLPEFEDHRPGVQPDPPEKSPGFWARTAEGTRIARAPASAIRDRSDSLARALNVALPLAADLDRALDLDVARALDLDLDLARHVTRAFADARARDLDLDRDVARDLTRAFADARARDLDLDRDLTRAFAGARARDLARDLDHALDRALTRDLDLDRDLDRARDRDLDRDLDHARDLARALVRALIHLIARNRAEVEKKLSGTGLMPRVLPFLNSYCIYTSLPLALWILYRLPPPNTGLSRFVERAEVRERNAHIRRTADPLVEIYVACTLNQLHREGKIPILGGIRVVRQRAPHQPNS